MNLLELVDRMCAVTEQMARIIRKQAFFIENCLSVDETVKAEFAALRKPVETELDLLEVRLRPIHNTGGDAGKENDGYDELVLPSAGSDIRAADREADGTEDRRD